MDTTLDAWEILQTVVQLGGFAPAAQKLNRSQSTISYAIGRLQQQLGVRLFEIHGRKAQLTEVGRALLADAEPHLAGFHQLEQRAHLMASGSASEVRLSVDSLFPDDRLFAAPARLFSLGGRGDFAPQCAALRDRLDVARDVCQAHSPDRNDRGCAPRSSPCFAPAHALAL
jgi:DNA-binding transcriptional LysR family regulator